LARHDKGGVDFATAADLDERTAIVAVLPRMIGTPADR
jgi:hypothetical protein